MKNDTLHTRNKATGEHESLKQFDIEVHDWGIRFFVGSEQDAYKAAYLYRLCYRADVGYSKNLGRWYVTALNEEGQGLAS